MPYCPPLKTPHATAHATAPASVAQAMPTELLQTIFAKLDTPDRLMAARTCSRWHQAAMAPWLWREQLHELPHGPEARTQGLRLVQQVLRPQSPGAGASGCIVGRSHKALTFGTSVAGQVARSRHPDASHLAVSCDGLPYSFLADQGLTPMLAPGEHFLALGGPARTAQTPLPPSPASRQQPLADLTPLLIRALLQRHWRRFDAAVCHTVFLLDGLLGQSVAHNLQSLDRAESELGHRLVRLNICLQQAESHEHTQSYRSAIVACLRDRSQATMTRRFLCESLAVMPRERWHVYPPVWALRAHAQGWLDLQALTVGPASIEQGDLSANRHLFSYVSFAPRPNP